MLSRSRTSPAGRPSTIATSAGPCDSPAVVEAQSHGAKPTSGPHDLDGRRDPRPALERRGALADERLEPVDDDPAAGRAGGLDERGRAAVGAVGEVDDGLLGPRLDEQLVGHRRRVHDEVGVARVRRPVAAAREDARLGGERREQRLRRAARADQAGARRLDPAEDLAVGVGAEHPAVAEDERVDGVAVGLVAEPRRRPPCAGS